jgi:hypothetical protein
MKPPFTPVALFPLIAALASACECADRRYPHSSEDSGTSGSDSMTPGSTAETALPVSSSATTDGAVDVSAFIGVFHSEHWLTPFGREVPNPGGVSLANLEIRADGTASMTMETCNLDNGTRSFSWRWQAHPGPWLELSPGSGEESLRFLALTDLEQLGIHPIGPCAFQFEADGERITTETFRPGEACWVNRCEPSYLIHIDYCDGEPPPPCD